jgi:hypothetical protein
MTTGVIEEERDTHLIRLWLFLPLGYSPIPPGPQSPPLCQSRAAARKEEELCLCGMVCGVGWLERSEMGRDGVVRGRAVGCLDKRCACVQRGSKDGGEWGDVRNVTYLAARGT